MSSRGSLTIEEVIENLNTLVEASSLDEIEITEDGTIVSHRGFQSTDAYIPAAPDEATLAAIRANFAVVYSYLQSFYKKMKDKGKEEAFSKGLESIMVLVGESAKKLEKFDILFQEKISLLEEYKNIKDFYQTRIVKEIGTSSQSDLQEATFDWEHGLEELFSEEEVEVVEGVHLLNNLEAVKSDHAYELFYLKNEAGHNFYTGELARTIKLACDFGDIDATSADPLLHIKNWEDKSLQEIADSLLSASKREVEAFYKETVKHRDVDIVSLMRQAVLALMLASNPKNLIRQFSIKGCHRYFGDFQQFLRQVLEHRDYQKLLLYSGEPGAPFLFEVIHLANNLIFDLFTQQTSRTEFSSFLMKLLGETKEAPTLSDFLAVSDATLRAVLKRHPSGPVFKALDVIREKEETLVFDPVYQGNLPGKELELIHNQKHISLMRIPSPTKQEVVSHAVVTTEFESFLYALASKKRGNLLFINFADRTSWREHARVKALEEMGNLAEFADKITVVTIAMDTDFYNQVGHYAASDDAKTFLSHFFEHLSDEIAGYHFPANIKNKIFPKEIKMVLEAIHKTFFENKKTLSHKERLELIEIAYHFLILKLIEVVEPTDIAFSSKDALDAVAIEMVGLAALLSIGQHKKLTSKERQAFVGILYGPTMIIRERGVHPEKVGRLIDVIKLYESHPDFLKEFRGCFDKSVLDMKVTI